MLRRLGAIVALVALGAPAPADAASLVEAKASGSWTPAAEMRSRIVDVGWDLAAIDGPALRDEADVGDSGVFGEPFGVDVSFTLTYDAPSGRLGYEATYGWYVGGGYYEEPERVEVSGAVQWFDLDDGSTANDTRFDAAFERIAITVQGSDGTAGTGPELASVWSLSYNGTALLDEQSSLYSGMGSASAWIAGADVGSGKSFVLTGTGFLMGYGGVTDDLPAISIQLLSGAPDQAAPQPVPEPDPASLAFVLLGALAALPRPRR